MDQVRQPGLPTPTAPVDVEKGAAPAASSSSEKRPQSVDDIGPQVPTEQAQGSDMSAFKALGWLDRLLAVWIFLAMAVGIILGNFVPSTGPTLQKGKFVGVSVPIGMSLLWDGVRPRHPR